MKIDLEAEEVVCLLFWFLIYQDHVPAKGFDRKLFKKLRKLLALDIPLPLNKAVTGIPIYQPGDRNVKT